MVKKWCLKNIFCDTRLIPTLKYGPKINNNTQDSNPAGCTKVVLKEAIEFGKADTGRLSAFFVYSPRAYISRAIQEDYNRSEERPLPLQHPQTPQRT
jgi:hypothetical protein